VWPEGGDGKGVLHYLYSKGYDAFLGWLYAFIRLLKGGIPLHREYDIV
jgi:hypothetical protein